MESNSADSSEGDGILVKCDSVTHSFGRGKDSRVVLQDINLELHKGEILTIVGPSGCGKTTLMRIVGGLLSPTQGQVTVGGKSATATDQRIGVVFQSDRLLPWRSVADNVGFGLEAMGAEKATIRAAVPEALKLVKLAHAADLLPHQMSGGMRQRANLARALAIQPTFLLMDEPFAALDAQTREFMQNELLRICDETGVSVLFITHQVDEAVYLGDRVVVLSGRPGQIGHDLRVPFDRPRPLELKTDAEFVTVVRDVWNRVRDEALATWKREES